MLEAGLHPGASRIVSLCVEVVSLKYSYLELFSLSKRCLAAVVGTFGRPQTQGAEPMIDS